MEVIDALTEVNEPEVDGDAFKVVIRSISSGGKIFPPGIGYRDIWPAESAITTYPFLTII